MVAVMDPFEDLLGTVGLLSQAGEELLQFTLGYAQKIGLFHP